MTKPGCQDRCGNISIPYPFGTTKYCFADVSFQIICNQTADGSARAFIRKINMEVLVIDKGAALVKGPIISYNCSGRKSSPPVNLEGSPFFFSFYNLFTAVGCNIRVLFTELGRVSTGCDSMYSAGTGTGSDYNQTSSIMYGPEINNICAGKNCCVARLPYRMQDFNPTFDATSASQDSASGCKLAFIAQDIFFNNMTDLQVVQMQGSEHVPVVLGWQMNYNFWTYDSNTMNCSYFFNELTPDNISAYECSCVKGYDGNPYLGCIDINECKDRNQHSCRGIMKCVNTPGSYKCEANIYWIVLISLGAMAGVLPLSWLYRLAKERKNRELRKKFFKRNGGLLLQEQLSSYQDGVQKTKIFESRELERARDFD